MRLRPVPRTGMSQTLQTTCPKRGPVQSIIKDESQERACPKKGLVPSGRYTQGQHNSMCNSSITIAMRCFCSGKRSVATVPASVLCPSFDKSKEPRRRKKLLRLCTVRHHIRPTHRHATCEKLVSSSLQQPLNLLLQPQTLGPSHCTGVA